ncbi:MAG: DNA-binding protein [Xanthomonadaceae bacterium]|mgnify:FL=1|nr:DNA-binding protein [Xanthomonadaceae bacterium]
MTLPDYLELRLLAEQQSIMAGRVPNRAMQRLRPSLADASGETEAELRFALDPFRRPMVSGWARTELSMVCQRCLQVYRQPLSVRFDLVLVRGESEAERLADGFEPLLLDSDRVSTVELLEDELILALPIVAMHLDERDCRLQAGELAASGETGEQLKPNPFAALAALKRKQV